ncbi:GNAT family N-acetyltransferase [Larsenimonas salina]|uniref:GNAT family N-acetyltransferase n=1 Tax=Larsenimonas salina TaxID=1295565 RepID=UPI002073AED9|nr:GNAT family N-acetyltransferase [Larsenimonas salina]MCM5704987.1 GNAT family N-acetyltransferase [Larsenimonas salina]
MTLELREIKGVDEIERSAWDALVDPDYPFMHHAFLSALELTGDVSEDTGWSPCHRVLMEQNTLVGFLPGFDKTHSYGEYIFDWQWADVWERAGQVYYPKQISAIPYTPSTGPRLVLADHIAPERALELVSHSIRAHGGSGWHLLFPGHAETRLWQQYFPELLMRHGMQYHWFNRGYETFDAFLDLMTSKRRKEVRRERRKVAEQGITLHCLDGEGIDEAAITHFYRCYQITYFERGQSPYLSDAFFKRLLATMPEHLMLVQARVGERPIAAALYFKGETTLYGRYWGSEVHADSLHFEACYYQGIEYCIRHGFTRFDPGTQGEHKIARGFEPITTYSLHWLRDARFYQAVADFLERERAVMDDVRGEAAQALPFKVASP